MRPQDKAALCGGGLSTPATTRPKLEKTDFGDALLPYSVTEPLALALGCTFSPELCGAVARYHAATAAENSLAFAGVVHAGIIRDPMSVTASEFFSEDPVLTKELLKSFDGAYGIGFVFTDCLGQGRFVNRTVDGRALHELYLMPLARAGRLAAAVQLDGGYLNGKKVCSDPDIFELYANCVDDDVPILTQYGDAQGETVEQIMGNGRSYLLGLSGDDRRMLASYAANGLISEITLNRSIERTLTHIVKIHDVYKSDLNEALDKAALPDIATESAVLLKNDGLLPVPDGSITVFGDASAFEDGARRGVKPIASAPDGLGSINLFLVTGYEETGVDALTARIIHGACAAAKTVVALCGACAADIDLNAANAVLFCPGAPTVKDVVSMLRGDETPRGRLPFTWCKSRGAYPCNNKKFIARGDFRYDSMYNGYLLHNNFKTDAVLYPFGHGLDYTEYELSKLELKSVENNIDVEFVIKNVGGRNGTAVCQAYITLQGAPVYGLTKRFAAFKRVPLDTTENASVKMHIDMRDFAVYDESAMSSAVLGGKYRVEVGLSSTDIRLSAECKVAAGSRSNAGLSQKLAPAYYNVGKKFEPSAPEIERLLKVPFIKKPDEHPELAPPKSAATKRLVKKVLKSAPVHVQALLKYKIENTPKQNGMI